MSYMQPVLDWFVSCILFLPRIIFWAGNQLLEVVIDELPPLDIVDPSTLTSGFTGDLLFFLTLMEFQYGLGAIASALVARFILRRVPFIG